MTEPTAPDPAPPEPSQKGGSSEVARLLLRLGTRPPTVDLRPGASEPAEPVTKSPTPDEIPAWPGERLHVLGEIARGGMGVILRGH
ncbi:MAG: hypothetical protein JNK15_02350, partial [Planctomycetes bacterium]|nr:hypothetical protein [Planctomycetota bacterium]